MDIYRYKGNEPIFKKRNIQNYNNYEEYIQDAAVEEIAENTFIKNKTNEDLLIMPE